MKLLFAFSNREHANEMHINNIRGIMSVGTVDFYGPGYSTKEELEDGLFAYWDENGGYDALILDYAIAMLHSECLDIREAYHWHRYFMSDYNIFDAIRYADSIVEDAKKIDTVKIILYWFDTVSFTERWELWLQKLLDDGFYFHGLGIEWFPEMEESEQLVSLGYSNRYRKFALNNLSKIISIPYWTADLSEFYYQPLEGRPYDVVICGNIDKNFYPTRGEILKKIKKSKYSLYNSYYDRTLAYRESTSRIECSLYRNKEDKFVDSGLKKASPYLDARLSRESIAMWRENFNVSLRKSQIGYADGGISRQLVRKFVEIAARGTVLICEDVPPLKNYGFTNGENMVIVDSENILEVCDELFENPKKMQSIANAGRKMLFEKHRPEIHAQHMMSAIVTIKKGKFKGTLWENGEFIIRE